MDNQRLILFLVFSFSLFFLFEAWQKDQHPPVAPAAASAPGTPMPATTTADVPTPSVALTTAVPAAAGDAIAPAGATVRVETDFLIAEINTAGGDLRRLELRNHRDTLDKTKTFVLLQQTPEHTYVAQSGLIGAGLPNHRTQYTADAPAYVLAPGADRLEVRLTAPAVNGVAVSKHYVFHRASYVIDVGYDLENKSTSTLPADAYFQFVRDAKMPAGSTKMMPTFTGAAVYTEQDKFRKVLFEDIDKGKTNYPKKSDNGWIAILQHYFLSAWLPSPQTPREFYTKKLDGGLYAAGVILPLGTIAPGQRAALTVPLYAGPQEQDKLAVLAPGLELSVDYGWLTIVAQPLFWFLQWVHQWTGNWGVTIIILTVLIKALFYPLSAASYRSMGRMRTLAPRLQKLKEQYGSDKQRLNQAMMTLYKTEKINPLGGCLPILVQIPVFIALYWVLLASVELRHAPFMMWVQDLSEPDPYYVLPVLMGATMIIQAWLSPAPPDPIQAKVMKIMPVAFSIFFFFFPAGLVLYWLVNNVLSIAQQWQINRSLESAPAARKS